MNLIDTNNPLVDVGVTQDREEPVVAFHGLPADRISTSRLCQQAVRRPLGKGVGVAESKGWFSRCRHLSATPLITISHQLCLSRDRFTFGCCIKLRGL